MGKTSTTSKRKWNDKNYTRIVADVPKDMAETFKRKCAAENVSQAQIIKEAIRLFIND